MIIGFTGSQKGMTSIQRNVMLHQVLLPIANDLVEAHHGDCIGSDEDFYDLIVKWLPDVKIVSHPPINPKKRAFCKLREGDAERQPKEYLDRNHDIVDESDMLIATPMTMEEELRSGTWATIRYARKMKKSIIIVHPDGSVGD